MSLLYFFFFFKQKTAYEMRISDWSSDVCSSDLSLDAIFLDEGFGTLDPEALDVVASAIEELGASGRMVGIVSHVRELAERVPVRFEIGRASCREGVCQYGWISVVAVSLKKQI